MDYDVDVYLLSEQFYIDYPETTYPEIMRKQGRPYNCLLIDSHDGYFICVPFRSYINHRNAYMFKNSQRALYCRSGLDYSKAVLIADLKYLDSGKAIVDQDEYNETMRNMDTIVEEVLEYVDTYIGHISGSAPIHQRQFQRKYQFSTLQYFHDILGLQSSAA